MSIKKIPLAQWLGEYEACVVFRKNPSCFGFIKKEDFDGMRNLEKGLKIEMPNQAEVEEVEVGKAYGIFYLNEWRRTVVEKINEDGETVQILCGDFGFEATVGPEEMRILPPQFLEQPWFGAQGYLLGLRPSAQTLWPKGAVQFFLERVRGTIRINALATWPERGGIGTKITFPMRERVSDPTNKFENDLGWLLVNRGWATTGSDPETLKAGSPFWDPRDNRAPDPDDDLLPDELMSDYYSDED